MLVCVLLFLFTTINLSFSDAGLNCTATKCYRSVNNTYGNLLELIDTLNSTEISPKPEFNKFKKDLKTIENGTKNFQKELTDLNKTLNPTELNVSNDQKTVKIILEKLNNISQYNITADKILKDAKIYQKNFEKLFEVAEKASKTCLQQRQNQYAEFQMILEELEKKYDDSDQRGKKIKNDVDKIFNETVKVENKFDALEFPTDLIEKYVNEVETNFTKMINKLKENSNLLKELLEASQKNWNAKIQSQAEKVTKIIREIQDDLTKINAVLSEYEKVLDGLTFTPTVDDESRKLLRNIRKQVKDLQKKLEEEMKSASYTGLEELLKQFSQRINEKLLWLKEFNLILDVLPDERDLDVIEKEINILKYLIERAEELNELRIQVELLRKQRDEILKINCGTVSENGLQ